MKVWIDMTASAHPLVFRPLVKLLREQGHEVEITTRDYAQTIQLIESHGMEATVIGHHGGRSRAGKARQLQARLHALRKWAGPRGFDLALAHGSHELTLTARRLGIPSSTTFDYEWARLQHPLGCRAAVESLGPDITVRLIDARDPAGVDPLRIERELGAGAVVTLDRARLTVERAPARRNRLRSAKSRGRADREAKKAGFTTHR